MMPFCTEKCPAEDTASSPEPGGPSSDGFPTGAWSLDASEPTLASDEGDEKKSSVSVSISELELGLCSVPVTPDEKNSPVFFSFVSKDGARSTVGLRPDDSVEANANWAREEGASDGGSTAFEREKDNYPEGGLRAWSVVAGSWFSMFACFGFMNVAGVYQAHVSRHQLAEYSASTIGWIFSIYIFLCYFCGVQVGPWFDAKGPRLPVALGSIFLLAGIFLLAQATSLWHFVVAYSVLCGLGTGLIFTPSIAAIAHWFRRRRGFATGVACTASSVSGVSFSLTLPSLFDRIGYAWATRIMGLVFSLALLAGNMLTRSRLPPRIMSVSSYLPDFRILFAGRAELFFCTMGIFAIEWGLFIPLTYIGSWATATGAGGSGGGISGSVASGFGFTLLAIINGSSFFGRWLPGLVVDRMGPFNTVIVACAVCLVSLMGLWLPASVPGSVAVGNTPLSIMFAVVFGIGAGSWISITPVCVGRLCSVEDYGRYYATSYTVVSIGCLTGVPIAGALVEACGGQYTGLVVFAACCYLMAVINFAVARVLLVGWRVKVFC